MERKSLINIMPIFFYGLYESQFNAVPSARATPRDFTCDLHNPIRARLAGLGILILLEKLRCKLRGMFQYSNDEGAPERLNGLKVMACLMRLETVATRSKRKGVLSGSRIFNAVILTAALFSAIDVIPRRKASMSPLPLVQLCHYQRSVAVTSS